MTDPRMINVDAERGLIGSVLLDPATAAHALDRVSADDFTKRTHRLIVEAAFRLRLRGAPIDTFTVAAELKAAGIGPAEVLEFVEAVPTAQNADYYAAQVREAAGFRQLAGLSSRRVLEGAETLSEAIAAWKAAIEPIERQLPNDGVLDGLTFAKRISARLEAARANPRMPGKRTGFRLLDKRIGGLRPAKLYVLGARPGMGKSAWAMQVGTHFALEHGEQVVVFSAEMDETELGERIIAAQARIDSTRVASGEISEDAEWRAVARTLSKLAESGFFLDDRPALPIGELAATAKRLHAKRRLGLVIIDYLQLIGGPPERRRETRELEVGAVARALKSLSKELGCPVVGLSQLNRKLEERPDKAPRLSDFRESGEIEQAADVILGLWRPGYYDDSADPSIAELLILKHRGGPLGKTTLRWCPEHVRFDNPADAHRGAEPLAGEDDA